MEKQKATKTAFSVGPPSTRQRNAFSMAFRWWADYGLLLVVIESNLKKTVSEYRPTLTKKSGSSHVQKLTRIIEFCMKQALMVYFAMGKNKLIKGVDQTVWMHRLVCAFVFRLLQISKVAKIRNRYNQVPHLTMDTNGKVTNSQKTPQTRAKRSALSQQVTTKHI